MEVSLCASFIYATHCTPGFDHRGTGGNDGQRGASFHARVRVSDTTSTRRSLWREPDRADDDSHRVHPSLDIYTPDRGNKIGFNGDVKVLFPMTSGPQRSTRVAASS
jgi:hypothetical protein